MVVDAKDSVFSKAVEYLFHLFFITFPFILYSGFLYNGTSTRSLNLILFSIVLGIGLAAWIFFKKDRVAFALSPLFFALLVYFLALVVSGFSGINFSTTFWSVATRTTGLWYFLSLGIFMLALFAVIVEERRHHTLIRSIIFSSALYSVLNLLGSDGFNLIFKDARADAFTFGNSTFAGMYLFGAFLLSLYYLLEREQKKWWMYALPLVIVMSPNITNPLVWTGNFSEGFVGEAQASSYAILLSLIMLGVVWFVSRVRDARRRVQASYALFVAGVLAVFIASFSLLSPGGYLREVYLAQSSAARPLVWQIAERAIGERPLLGFGADNFERVFERFYDNRLLEEKYGEEAWFDRAHNIFIDQLVDNGAIGLLLYFAVYLATLFALIQVALNAPIRRDQLFASVLIVYFTLHIAELQTAFDTSISYPMLAFMFVSAAVLYHRTRPLSLLSLNAPTKYAGAAALLVFSIWSLVAGAWPLTKAQLANGEIRRVGSGEKRIPLYPDLFGSPVDEQAFLWRTSTDFQRGIAEDPRVLGDPKKVEFLKQELLLFENGYRQYLGRNPDNFRAHLNLADILIYQRLFEVNKLEEAQKVLDRAIELVPQSPQPYWMKAVAYIYMRKFDLAREYAKEGLALNPTITQSQEVVKYVEDSIRTFPDITLFFFRQI